MEELSDIDKFYVAIRDKDNVIINELLKKIDVNTKDEHDRTFLYYAILHDNIEVVNTLLKNNIDINSKDKFGRTALMCAIQKKNKVIVNVLLKIKDIDINVIDNNKQTLLSYAIVCLPEIAIELIDKTSIDNINSENSPLIIAIKFFTNVYVGAYNVYNIIIDKLLKIEDLNVNIINDIRTNNGVLKVTPLMYAIYLKKSGIIDKLLEIKGLDINIIINLKDDKLTALHFAIKFFPEVVNTLIDNENINININSKTLISLAIQKSNFTIVKKLLDKNVNFNISFNAIVNIYGNEGIINVTPLMYALFVNEDIFNILFNKSDTDVNFKNDKNITVLDIAIHLRNFKAVNKLLKKTNEENINNSLEIYYKTIQFIEINDDSSITDFLKIYNIIINHSLFNRINATNLTLKYNIDGEPYFYKILEDELDEYYQSPTDVSVPFYLEHFEDQNFSKEVKNTARKILKTFEICLNTERCEKIKDFKNIEREQRLKNRKRKRDEIEKVEEPKKCGLCLEDETEKEKLVKVCKECNFEVHESCKKDLNDNNIKICPQCRQDIITDGKLRKRRSISKSKRRSIRKSKRRSIRKKRSIKKSIKKIKRRSIKKIKRRSIKKNKRRS